MNNYRFDKFIRDLQAIRLQQEEKDTMRRELAAFAYQYQPTHSPYHKLFVYMRQGAAFALAILLVVGGASKGASARALPGEILYPVKIIHEEIESATKTKKEDKISYEIKRTETRIKEATQLAKSDKLDNKKQEELAKDIKKHTEEVRSKIKKVQEKDPKQALALNSEMKTTLKVNSEALKQVATTAQEKKDEEVTTETQTQELPINEVDIALEDDSQTIIVVEEVVDLLIDSIDEEVAETEALGAEVEEQIILENDVEEDEGEEDEIKTTEKETQDIEQKIDYFERVLKIEAEITNIKEQLKKIRVQETQQEAKTEEETLAPENNVDEILEQLSETVDEKTSPETTEDIKEHIETRVVETVVDLIQEDQEEIKIIRAEADQLVAEKKYGQAFIKLQTILEKYREQLVGQQIEKEFDVDIVKDLSEKEIDQDILVEEKLEDDPSIDTEDELPEPSENTEAEVESDTVE